MEISKSLNLFDISMKLSHPLDICQRLSHSYNIDWQREFRHTKEKPFLLFINYLSLNIKSEYKDFYLYHFELKGFSSKIYMFKVYNRNTKKRCSS